MKVVDLFHNSSTIFLKWNNTFHIVNFHTIQVAEYIIFVEISSYI